MRVAISFSKISQGNQMAQALPGSLAHEHGLYEEEDSGITSGHKRVMFCADLIEGRIGR
ncbi:MAG: hypothetical protein ACYDGY_07645 [Acidimicrobiales bacterium]